MTTVKLAVQLDRASLSRCFNLKSADLNHDNDVEHRRRGSLSHKSISSSLLKLEAILANAPSPHTHGHVLYHTPFALSKHTHTHVHTLITHTYSRTSRKHTHTEHFLVFSQSLSLHTRGLSTLSLFLASVLMRPCSICTDLGFLFGGQRGRLGEEHASR